MRRLEVEELVGSLEQLLGDVTNHLDSIRRKIVSIESDRANMMALIRFQEKLVDGSDYIPHASVRRVFSGSEVRDYCLQALRAAEGPLDTRELARHCMARKGLDSEDILVRKKIVFTVMSAMKTARRRGMVESGAKRKGVLLWRLKAGQDMRAKR